MCHNCFPVIDFRKQLEICKEFTYSAEKFLQAFFIFFYVPPAQRGSKLVNPLSFKTPKFFLPYFVLV